MKGKPSVFVIWGEWDGGGITECSSRKEAAGRAAEILKKAEAEENGTSLLKVIEGRELNVEVVERVKAVVVSESDGRVGIPLQGGGVAYV